MFAIRRSVNRLRCVPLPEVDSELCRLFPYGQFGDVDDANPNETNIYLTQQLNQFGLAYIHFIEPCVAGNVAGNLKMDCEVEHDSFNTQHISKVWKGTFMLAGELPWHHLYSICCPLTPSKSHTSGCGHQVSPSQDQCCTCAQPLPGSACQHGRQAGHLFRACRFWTMSKKNHCILDKCRGLTGDCASATWPWQVSA